jgi:hypothetical protein
VAHHKLAIRFWRRHEATGFQVIDGDASIVECRELKTAMPYTGPIVGRGSNAADQAHFAKKVND